jgi:hypothetical protein
LSARLGGRRFRGGFVLPRSGGGGGYLPAFGLGTGGVISIIDPSGFEGTGLGVFRAVPAGGPAPVPLPAGAWLLLAGLCGMVALRRARG